MEKRFFLRLSINDEAKITSKDGVFAGTLENISLGGLFIRTDQNMELGEIIDINIALPCNTGCTNVTANVMAVRIENKGIAFKFNNYHPNDFWTLQSFIHCANA